MEKLRNLYGMHDLSQKSWLELKSAQERLREYFALHGYSVLETPLLEPTELFLRKSGGELAARMYTFTDPGGNQVSLRPEYTASVVRHYLSGDSTEPLPIRVQYAGPVFRYEGAGEADHQFTQVGVELLGSSSPRADAEILSISCTALSELGLKGQILNIGDIGVLHGLLESLGLSERATTFILGSVNELKAGKDGLARVMDRARQLGLLADHSRQGYLRAATEGMEENEARELLHRLLQWAEIGSLGQREPSDVVERLLRKIMGTDDPGSLQRGLEVIHRLASVKGEPQGCLKEVEEIITSFRLDPVVLDRLKELTCLLAAERLEGATVVLDFGLARGLAYYTGIIFEITHPQAEGSLSGGGRYDGLARALGSPSNVPALGFAYALESILTLIDRQGKKRLNHNDASGRVLLLAPNGAAYKKALQVAQEMRGSGTAVEVDVASMGVEESLPYARDRGIATVMTIDGNGKRSTHKV